MAPVEYSCPGRVAGEDSGRPGRGGCLLDGLGADHSDAGIRRFINLRAVRLEGDQQEESEILYRSYRCTLA